MSAISLEGGYSNERYRTDEYSVAMEVAHARILTTYAHTIGLGFYSSIGRLFDLQRYKRKGLTLSEWAGGNFKHCIHWHDDKGAAASLYSLRRVLAFHQSVSSPGSLT